MMRRTKTAQTAMSLFTILTMILGLPMLAAMALFPTLGAWALLLCAGLLFAGLETLEWLGEVR